jgi:hypothetical protein
MASLLAPISQPTQRLRKSRTFDRDAIDPPRASRLGVVRRGITDTPDFIRIAECGWTALEPISPTIKVHATKTMRPSG